LAIGLGVRASSLVLIAFGCTGFLDAAGSMALVVQNTFGTRLDTKRSLNVTSGWRSSS
jgi:hypothetical protein